MQRAGKVVVADKTNTTQYQQRHLFSIGMPTDIAERLQTQSTQQSLFMGID